MAKTSLANICTDKSNNCGRLYGVIVMTRSNDIERQGPYSYEMSSLLFSGIKYTGEEELHKI
jgi:hypothetical protein